MPSFKSNVTELKSYVKQAMVENRPKIDHLIRLYEAKRLPNYKTIFNATITLASKNKLTSKSGRGEKYTMIL